MIDVAMDRWDLDDEAELTPHERLLRQAVLEIVEQVRRDFGGAYEGDPDGLEAALTYLRHNAWLSLSSMLWKIDGKTADSQLPTS